MIYVQVHVYKIHTFIYMCVHTQVDIYSHACAYTYICMRTYAYTHNCRDMYVDEGSTVCRNVHVYEHMCIHMYIYVLM